MNLEIFIAEQLVAGRREREAVGDLQTCVGDQAKQGSLSDAQVGKVHFVAVLDQLHPDLKIASKCDCEVRGHCVCKEIPVIPVERVVDKERKIKGRGGGGEAQ
jgi:hypothetical protein